MAQGVRAAAAGRRRGRPARARCRLGQLHRDAALPTPWLQTGDHLGRQAVEPDGCRLHSDERVDERHQAQHRIGRALAGEGELRGKRHPPVRQPRMMILKAPSLRGARIGLPHGAHPLRVLRLPPDAVAVDDRRKGYLVFALGEAGPQDRARLRRRRAVDVPPDGDGAGKRGRHRAPCPWSTARMVRASSTMSVASDQRST